MPYTPPSQLSPAASTNPSPTPSRSHSYIKGHFLSPELPASSARPNLPRSSASSSYLTKQRRSPSLNDAKEVLHNGEASQDAVTFDPHGSIRSSPPPMSNSLIPAGMTISPPDSSHNSSDDDEPQTRGRTMEMDIERENLEALQAAIMSIKQRKESSPIRGDGDRTSTNMDASVPQVDGTPQHQSAASRRPPLSQEARKISHSRSSTDSSIVFEPPKVNPPVIRADTDDSDSDNPSTDRPPMVRKKSGELVRPALRPSSRRRPSSMPGTPTYSKAVHFDSHLEHVRHFLQVDRPLAVSAGSSPVENYESEGDFPFGSEESSARPRSAQYEWEMRLANFPPHSDVRTAYPVFVERVFLSSDNKNLIGTVAVQNLAFQKSVVARFTLDYWKTTSEVAADYNNDVRRKQNHDGLDRFNFSIRLADQANLENKTLFFCVRYSVNGQDFWDNNGTFNYQVDFAKKSKFQHGKQGVPGLGARPLNALPRSRPSPPTSTGRPASTPTSFDDFSTGFDSFIGSVGSLMGEPKLKLRSSRPKAELVPDAPQRRKNGGAQAFGNRYDFNSSLTAAKNHAVAALGEFSGLASRTDTKQSSHEVPATTPANGVAIARPKQEIGVNGPKTRTTDAAPAAAPMISKPAALVSEKPSLTSPSYQELVDKYCFFGTARSPEPLTKTALNLVNGIADSASASDLSTGASPRSSNSSGSSTPTPPRSLSPTPNSQFPKPYVPYLGRSSSPLPRSGGLFGSRSQSPVSFGYPYHSPSQHTLMSETPTPTAIQG